MDSLDLRVSLTKYRRAKHHLIDLSVRKGGLPPLVCDFKRGDYQATGASRPS